MEQQQLIAHALLTLDNAYPYPMDEENLRIEYLTLMDRDSTKLSVEDMATRMIRTLDAATEAVR